MCTPSAPHVRCLGIYFRTSPPPSSLMLAPPSLSPATYPLCDPIPPLPPFPPLVICCSRLVPGCKFREEAFSRRRPRHRKRCQERAVNDVLCQVKHNLPEPSETFDIVAAARHIVTCVVVSWRPMLFASCFHIKSVSLS